MATPARSASRSRRRFLAAAAAVTLVVSLVAATVAGQRAKLDADEERLRRTVASRLTTHALPFLATTVDTSSGTLDAEGVRRVADLYQPRFERLGFTTSRIDLARVQRGCHLVAERRGTRAATRVMLLGHLDTVFEKDSGFTRYVATGGGRLEGPGISDMKGGNLVMLEALEALANVADLDRLDVVVVLTGDEELPGPDPDGSFRTTRGPVVELAARSDLVLAFEPMNGRSPRPIVARRGYAWWSLEVRAPSAHSSLAFTKPIGPGAIVPLSRILDRFYRELRTDRLVSFNVGNVAGGTGVEREKGRETEAARASGKLNVVPSSAHAYGDLRTPSAAQLEQTHAAMKRIVGEEIAAFNAEHDPAGRIDVELVLKDEYPAMAPSAGGQALLELLSEASQDLGGGKLEAADPVTQGAGDVSFVAGKVQGAIDGLGPVGFDYHTPREATDATSLRTATERAAVLLHRLSRGRLPPRR